MSSEVARKRFDKITRFVKGLGITDEYIGKLKSFVLDEWEKRKSGVINETEQKQKKIEEMKVQAKNLAHKIAMLNSEVAIKYIEEDLIKVEEQIKELESAKINNKTQEINMEVVMASVEYFLEHLDFLLLEQPNRIKRAVAFGLLFDEAPTYEEINSGTPRLAPFLRLKGGTIPPLLPNGEQIDIDFEQLYGYLTRIYETMQYTQIYVS